MDGVIGMECFKDCVDLCLARPRGDSALDQLPNAIADECTHLRKRSGRKALCGECIVESLPQVGQRIEQCPVQIKNCKLIHDLILAFVCIRCDYKSCDPRLSML